MFSNSIQIVCWQQVCPPGVMASRENLQEGPTPPLTSPILESTYYILHISFCVVLILNNALFHLIELLFQGSQLFLETYLIFRPLNIDSQVYELPSDELG